MSTEVRYGNNNAVLRLVLHNLWGNRCYWCGRPKDFTDIEIDHIIPRSTGPERIAELILLCGLRDDFDLDDPANLAPICSYDNGPSGKGAKDLAHMPMVITRLERAEELRGKVIDRVQRFHDSRQVAEGLIRANETDLSNPKALRAFKEHAPAIVQKLALVDEGLADFLTYRAVAVEADGETPLAVGLALNARGRTAATIFEDIAGCSLGGMMQECVADVVARVGKAVVSEFETLQGIAGGPTSSGPPVHDQLAFEIDSIGYKPLRDGLRFTFAGSFDGRFTASLIQDSPEGGELIDVQGDADVAGQIEITADWHGTIRSGNLRDLTTIVRELRIDASASFGSPLPRRLPHDR